MKPASRNILNTLRMKVAIVVVLASLIGGGIFVFMAQRTGHSLLEREAEAKAYAMAGFGKAILEHLMLEGKGQRVRELLQIAVSFPQILDAFVVKPTGEVAMSAGTSTNMRYFDLKDYDIDPGNHEDR
ncbi:MAG: hypothetical protein AAB393_15935, partial [Bacteroidota bacterium]